MMLDIFTRAFVSAPVFIMYKRWQYPCMPSYCDYRLVRLVRLAWFEVMDGLLAVLSTEKT